MENWVEVRSYLNNPEGGELLARSEGGEHGLDRNGGGSGARQVEGEEPPWLLLLLLLGEAEFALSFAGQILAEREFEVALFHLF